MCYQRGKPEKFVEKPLCGSTSRIYPLANQLEYMNINRPSKTRLPIKLEPSKPQLTTNGIRERREWRKLREMCRWLLVCNLCLSNGFRGFSLWNSFYNFVGNVSSYSVGKDMRETYRIPTVSASRELANCELLMKYLWHLSRLNFQRVLLMWPFGLAAVTS